MTPWELAERLAHEDQEVILAELAPDDAFWVGASFAVDPFVGIIYRLPLRDPPRYGSGVSPQVFDKLARYILDGKLTGDPLAMAIEQFSVHCREAEWSRWYRRILKGELNLRLPLALFNRYAPDQFRVPPPVLNRPKPIASLADLPKRFVLTPDYGERTFWLINSKVDPIEICGYDAQIRRYENRAIAIKLADFARKHAVDIVLTGFVQGEEFLAEDILTREQFTQESGAHPLHRRAVGIVKLGLPIVQMTDLLVPDQMSLFYHELNLILEQRYEGAIVRDLDANYPFRIQPDRLIRPSIKATLTVKEILPEIGILAEYTRGKKQIVTMVHLGLTEPMLRDISESQGKRFDVVSCGVKDSQLLFPVFKHWRSE